MANTTNGSLSLASNPLDSACENYPSTDPTSPTWGPLARRLPEALLACIEADIQTRNQQPCSGVRKRGRFACTLGCGALLRSNQDRKRHEEAIYPTDYWICYICVQPHQPLLMKGQFFHRLDKIRAHCATHRATHHGGRQLNLDHCKVLGLSTPSPLHCKLCQHQYVSQRDREMHPLQRHTTMPSREVAQAAEIGATCNLKPSSQSHITDGIDTTSRREIGYCPQSCFEPGFLQASRHAERPLQPTSKPVLDFQFLANKPLLQPECMPIAQDAIKWLGKVSDKGGTAKVFKVELAYDMAQRCLSQPMLYAVKQFRESNHHIFRHEVQMYAIASANGLHGFTQCHGSFEYADSDGHVTYNLLLELAHGGDLMDYWLSTQPPRDFNGIKTYYAAIFDVAFSLRGLHSTPLRREDSASKQPRDVFWRHGDIKPENILRFSFDPSPWGGTLRLADLGRATHHLTTNDLRQSQRHGLLRYDESDRRDLEPMPIVESSKRMRLKLIDTGYDQRLADGDGGGTSKFVTRRYQPPHKPGGPDWVEQRADIWALGMVFSFAATWAVLGSTGLRAFEACRRSALAGSVFASDLPFHDGTRLLPAVIAWHQHLKRHKHWKDTITAPLLDLLEFRLLEAEPVLRADANEVCDQLHSLLELAEQEWQTLCLTSYMEDSAHRLHYSPLEDTVDLSDAPSQGLACEETQMWPEFFDSGVFFDTSEIFNSELEVTDPWLGEPSQSAWEANDSWVMSRGEDEWELTSM